MKINIIAVVIFLISMPIFSQEEAEKKAKTTFTASVDTYYAANFNDVPTTITFPRYQDDAFTLGWISAGILHEAENYGFQANLAFGPKNDDFFKTGFYSEEESVFNHIRDAFGYFNITDKLTVTAGLMQTYYGYELDDVHLNGNYSNGYIYALSSAGFAGAKLDYAFNDNWNLMVGVFNNVYQREQTGSDTNKAFTTNLAYSNNVFSAALTYLNSTEPDGVTLNLFDLVGAVTISEKFTLGYNVHNMFIKGGEPGFDSDIFAAALYPLYTINDKFSIGLRAEILKDEEGYFSLVNDNDLYNVTATLNYYISEHLKISPEIRLDGASEDTFEDVDGNFVSDDSFAIIALTYQF